jgi:hypothetical protein
MHRSCLHIKISREHGIDAGHSDSGTCRQLVRLDYCLYMGRSALLPIKELGLMSLSRLTGSRMHSHKAEVPYCSTAFPAWGFRSAQEEQSA